jgi:5'-deoxynucleotidase YfbR-like HD superfamily hydrolase
MDYYFSDDVKRIKFAREAACVIRSHAASGNVRDSVGLHSFNMVTMLLILYPEASRDLILACVKHDLPERITGDMPSPAKKGGIQRNAAQEDTEYNLNFALFGSHEEAYLNAEDLKWFKGLDMLEYYCYLKDELMSGNMGITAKVKRLEESISKSSHLYAVEVVNAFYLIKEDSWLTMPDMEGA